MKEVNQGLYKNSLRLGINLQQNRRNSWDRVTEPQMAKTIKDIGKNQQIKNKGEISCMFFESSGRRVGVQDITCATMGKNSGGALTSTFLLNVVQLSS